MNLFFTKETDSYYPPYSCPLVDPPAMTTQSVRMIQLTMRPTPSHNPTITSTSTHSSSATPSMYCGANTFQTIRYRSRNAALSVIPRSGVVGKRLCHIIMSCKWGGGVIHMPISSVREGNEHGGAKRPEDYQQGRERVDTVRLRTKADTHWICSKESHGTRS